MFACVRAAASRSAATLPFVISTEADLDFLPRAASDDHVCGSLFKESRMQIIEATGLDRKSGGAQWRDLRFSVSFLEMFFCSPDSSPPLIPTFLPVGTRRSRKALHRPVQILPGNVALTFADQIDDPLMGFQVFTPHRGLLMTGRYAHANEGKKRQQNAAGMLQHKRIAGNLA